MICLVTDRRRLVAAGASADEARACLVAQARHAAAAAIDLIQVRERDLEAGALATLVAELVDTTRGTRTRIVVNDRLDVALAAGAAGVQLRGDSMPVAAARRIAPPGFLIGRSVHSVKEAAAAAGADYLIAGTVYPSASKPAGRPLLGTEGLQAIVRAVTLPVLAIGGIDAARFDEIAATGAAGLAAIGLFIGSHSGAGGGGCRAVELRQTVNRARAVFDRPNTTP
jgi:thiamine-phosphate pyrophosphorylase